MLLSEERSALMARDTVAWFVFLSSMVFKPEGKSVRASAISVFARPASVSFFPVRMSM